MTLNTNQDCIKDRNYLGIPLQTSKAAGRPMETMRNLLDTSNEVLRKQRIPQPPSPPTHPNSSLPIFLYRRARLM